LGERDKETDRRSSHGQVPDPKKMQISLVGFLGENVSRTGPYPFFNVTTRSGNSCRPVSLLSPDRLDSSVIIGGHNLVGLGVDDQVMEVVTLGSRITRGCPGRGQFRIQPLMFPSQDGLTQAVLISLDVNVAVYRSEKGGTVGPERGRPGHARKDDGSRRWRSSRRR
jgi:hypothetical protein